MSIEVVAMSPVNQLNTEEKLLYNGLLFCELRLQKEIDIKLTNLEKYLAKGVDVNIQDANDNNNTPLHIAVKMDEPKIVEFLLQKGANPKANNINKHTPIDLAILCQNKNKNYVINIIEASVMYKKGMLDQNQMHDNAILNKKYKENEKKTEENEALINDSRSGTAGISGHFYESKLLGLLLHRALNDQDIDIFYIGSNLSGLGAFDDIAFKYKLKNKENSKVFFVQAKHRDDPSRNKLTMESILNSNKDFSLDKYFISFMKIRQKMEHKNKNVMYQNDEYHVIIYTTAWEDFHKKKLINIDGKESLLLSSDKGKSFMYDYDENDVAALLKNIIMLEAKSLAKTFAENINRHKYENMLLNELIGIYHVFIAQNIVQISNEKCEKYIMGSFRKSFLESRDEILVLIKETMFKEMKMHDEISKPSQEIAMQFKLPKYFGNLEVPLNDEEYVDLWRVIKLLIGLGKETKMKDNIAIIFVDDIMVDKILTSDDMNKIRYLVGDTLIFDDETGWFKFNLEDLSSDKNKRLLVKLKSNVKVTFDLKNFRFEINIQNFPQLSLRNGAHHKKNLTDFLNILQFHTNQAKEEELEHILKKEINSLYVMEYKNRNSFYNINGDAIYLNYYDRIQKWWRKQEKKYYLTIESRKFYEKAKESILNSPLLYNFNYIYVTKIKSLMLNFSQNAVDDLGLQAFMDRSDAHVLNIITKDQIFTSIKMKQYFDKKFLYFFVDLDIVSEIVDNEAILSEISNTQMDVLILNLSETGNITDFEMKFINRLYNKKIIVISHSKTETLKTKIDCLELIDESNRLCDFDIATQEKIVNERNILFQGSQLPFSSLVDEKMYNLVKGNLLKRVMKNDILKIGKVLMSAEVCRKNKEFYVNRRICRCLMLIEEEYCNNFIIIDGNSIADSNINKDILIISNDIDAFNENCKRHFSKNIHWFKRKYDKMMWVKSYGSLKNIVPFVKVIKCNENDKCSLEVKSLKHLTDRVVIISAGSGMGKSTLLEHLITETKNVHVTQTCVLKFNLRDLKKEFSTWQERDGQLKLGWFMTTLYKSFSTNKIDFFNSANYDEEVFDDITFVDYEDNIHLNTTKVSKIDELTLFEFQYFINLYNDNKITILLDGFDEICPDYKKVAFKLLKLLLTSRIRNIWITTRPWILNELEYEMNTFSYKLKGFTINDQIEYLEKFWTISLSQTNQVKDKTACVKFFLDVISNKFMDSQKYFTSVPLHLSMISKTFKEHFINYYTNETTQYRDEFLDALNLSTLYKKFINKKIDEIRFGEKKDALTFKDSDMITMKEEHRILLIKNHKIISAYYLLNKKIKRHQKKWQSYAVKNPGTKVPYCKDNLVAEGILTTDDLKHVKGLIQRFSLRNEKTGIIEAVVQNEPIFVHISYAEYFASEFLCDRVRQRLFNESTSKYLINHILVMENAGIRRFIDAKLEKDQTISKFFSKYISGALLSQRHSNKSALFCAVTEGRDNIALFLLNNLNVYLKPNNVDDFIALLVSKQTEHCTLCSTYHYRSVKVMPQVIEMVKRVDSNKLKKLFFCNDYPKCNILSLSILFAESSFHLATMDEILKYTDSKTLVKLTIELQHATSRFYERRFLYYMVEVKENLKHFKYIITKLNEKQRVRVFCARDNKRRVPAHFAATYDNFEFFEIMADSVGKEQFKRICTLKDVHGMIPLRCFGAIFLSLDKFKAICTNAGINIGFREGGGWFLYDIDNPDYVW